MPNNNRREIEEASYLLDGQNPLDPSIEGEYRKFYVSRPVREALWLRESTTARRSNRTFHWFYTGHTGSGKSTELNIMMTNPRLTECYLPVYFNIEQELDVHNLEHTDLILAMARSCVGAASQVRCPIPKELLSYMDSWGKEVLSEEESKTISEGTGGLKIDMVFLKLGEEVKSGGAKRKLVRERLYDDTSEFIRQIDVLADTLRDKTGREPLCILDGLDHVDTEPCRELLANYYITLTKPRLSKLFVIPLSLINTDFASQIEDVHSTLPNIKVFRASDDSTLDPEGHEFFREVISRYLPLSCFAEDALESLFRLSAGIVRDMIKRTGDACGYAADEGAESVELSHVRRVWDRQIQFYRRILYTSDYETLRKVADNPYPQGMDNFPRLLFQKAIVFYPNGQGWYDVHPAVREIIDPPPMENG